MKCAGHGVLARAQALGLAGGLVLLSAGAWGQDASLTVRPFAGVAPAAVRDLTATGGPLEGPMTLSWTAPTVFPGDLLDAYELRIQTFSVADVGGSTSAWWSHPSGALLQGFYGESPGAGVVRTVGLASSSHVLVLPQSATHYFAVRSADDAGLAFELWSEPSEIAVVAAREKPPPKRSSSTLVAANSATVLSVVPATAAVNAVVLVTVEIPPNVLPQGALLTLDGEPQSLPRHEARSLAMGGAVELNAGGAQPQGAMRITCRFDPSRLPPQAGADNIRLAFHDPAQGRWRLLPSSVDLTRNEVSGLTTHFSLFAPFVVLAAPDLDSVLIMPIPWKPGSGDSQFDAPALSLRNLPFPAKVTLYNLLGERVWHGEGNAAGRLEWPGTNDSGGQVGSGTYFIIIEGGGKTVQKRAVVIR